MLALINRQQIMRFLLLAALFYATARPARRRYIRRYVRTPAIRRERSIDLSFVVARPPCRCHATPRYPRRPSSLVGRSGLGFGGGCCWFYRVWRVRRSAFPSRTAFAASRDPAIRSDGSTGVRRKKRLEWLSVAASQQAPPTKLVDTARAKYSPCCQLRHAARNHRAPRYVVVGQSVRVGGGTASQWSPGSRAAQTRCALYVPRKVQRQQSTADVTT